MSGAYATPCIALVCRGIYINLRAPASWLKFLLATVIGNVKEICQLSLFPLATVVFLGQFCHLVIFTNIHVVPLCTMANPSGSTESG
jgi:hypothetical protein